MKQLGDRKMEVVERIAGLCVRENSGIYTKEIEYRGHVNLNRTGVYRHISHMIMAAIRAGDASLAATDCTGINVELPWTCLSDYGGDGIVGVANQRYYKAEYGLQLMYLHTASFTVIRLQDWRRLTIWQLEEIADMLERREFPGEDLISDVEYEWLRESLDFNKYEIEKKLEQWADIAAIWDNMTLEKQTDLYVSAVYDAEVEIVPEYSSVYVCDLEVVGALIPAKLATSNPVSS